MFGRTKKEVLAEVREFVGREGNFVEEFVESNCPWLEEGTVVFPSSWLSEEDLEAVLEDFFIGAPVVSWDGYMFQFSDICIAEATALVFCKEGEGEKNLFLIGKEAFPAFQKILDKSDREEWWDK